MIKIGVTGHQNIPFTARIYIEREILTFLKDHEEKFIGISSLAVGADQLYAENVVDAKGKLHAVVPCKNYESTFNSQADLMNYLKLLMIADVVEELEFLQPTEEAFLQAGKRIVDLSDILIAVWDGKQAKGKGGTADIVQYAQKLNKKVEVFWPDEILR